MTATRQPKGIPVGGQFAATAHSESDVALQQPTFTEYEAPITGTAKLNLGSFEKLPEWPAGMPEPSVTYDFDDGKVNTYIDIDPSGSIRSMRFWTDDIDGTHNTTDHGENPWEEFDEEDQEAARAYGKEVHERIDSSTYGVMLEATTQGKVREIILAHATGQPVEAQKSSEPTREQLAERAGQKYMAAQKALKDHDRLSMASLSAEIKAVFPTATEFRVTQNVDGRGSLWGHHMSTIRDADGNALAVGDKDARFETPRGERGVREVFGDIRKDFFEDKHPEMGFGFFDYDQGTKEIIVPLQRDYTEGIED
jgi:hypothetical protein